MSPRSYFVFTPLLASCSVGTLEYRTALEPIRSRRSSAEFYQGWADGVDFSNKRLMIEEAVQDPAQGLALTGARHEDESPGQRKAEKEVEKKKGKLFDMSWDKLVVTVGCYSQTFGTPGVRENAFFLKDVGDARNIRNRLLECFEKASLPTTSTDLKRQLLHFAVVGGGPTGIEFSAELHDIITEDMSKLYPELIQYYKISVYDVAEKVLSMFDEQLSRYAVETFRREGIEILTSHHVEELRRGAPKALQEQDMDEDPGCFTLKIKEGGEIGVGMCVWSTGLMANPFVENSLKGDINISKDMIKITDGTSAESAWQVKTNPKSGAIITDDRLRMVLESPRENVEDRAVVQDVFALGDCAMMEDAMYPATAQVANQKARWLAKRLNKKDIDQTGFTYKDLGVMAYVGNWNAIMQSNGGHVSGRVAWLIWRGAYLAKSVSWRNRILIPTYWYDILMNLRRVVY